MLGLFGRKAATALRPKMNSNALGLSPEYGLRSNSTDFLLLAGAAHFLAWYGLHKCDEKLRAKRVVGRDSSFITLTNTDKRGVFTETFLLHPEEGFFDIEGETASVMGNIMELAQKRKEILVKKQPRNAKVDCHILLKFQKRYKNKDGAEITASLFVKEPLPIELIFKENSELFSQASDVAAAFFRSEGDYTPILPSGLFYNISNVMENADTGTRVIEILSFGKNQCKLDKKSTSADKPQPKESTESDISQIQYPKESGEIVWRQHSFFQLTKTPLVKGAAFTETFPLYPEGHSMFPEDDFSEVKGKAYSVILDIINLAYKRKEVIGRVESPNFKYDYHVLLRLYKYEDRGFDDVQELLTFKDPLSMDFTSKEHADLFRHMSAVVAAFSCSKEVCLPVLPFEVVCNISSISQDNWVRRVRNVDISFFGRKKNKLDKTILDTDSAEYKQTIGSSLTQSPRPV